MRDLTDEFKLSARSTGEVFVTLGQMVNRLKVDRRVRFRGKKPTRAAIVNAALLYLDSLPQADWERALQVGLTRLEGFLADGDDAAAAPPAVAEPSRVGPEAGPAPRPATKRAPEKGSVSLDVEDISPEQPAEVPATRRKRRG